MKEVVRIGGACGAYGDSTLAVPQLLRAPDLDYLILDYLSEPVMAMFAKLAMAEPDAGYPPDFLNVHIGPFLHAIVAKKVKVVSNAGALRPRALAKALESHAREQGLSIRVAAIDGDDLRARAAEFRTAGTREMYSDAPFPECEITSCNAYFGALPIAEALARGADIVVTGRVVDSALVLGPLIHEFGWKTDDYDRLAAGTAAGHLLECGAQVSGGTFTDWRDVPNWSDAGFPIGECRADGTVVITKPSGTGGLISVGTVAEQLLYEVGDPQAYMVPDVTCDFSAIRLEQIGPDRVRVSGAKGYPPTSTFKACLSYDDGFRGIAYLPIVSTEAVAKAERQSAAVLSRLDRMLRDQNLGPFAKTNVEIIGAESNFGAHARVRNAREVMLRIAVEHKEKRAIDLFARESPCSVMSMSAGSTVGFVQTGVVSRLFMFLLPKRDVTAALTLAGDSQDVPVPLAGGFRQQMISRPSAAHDPNDADTDVPLVRLAWARSGDKGDLFNVAAIARRAQYLPYIRAALTTDAVAAWYAHLFNDPSRRRVERFEAPGVHALNFLVHGSLDGGSTASARMDFVAKGMAQQLLEFPVPVPAKLAASLAREAPDARPFVGVA
ncbi:MAG: acyclic terpene utilization AtuA family protein [Rhizomicrobium sp.]